MKNNNKKYEHARIRILSSLQKIIVARKDMTMSLSEFLKKSGICKNTFYAHYSNLGEMYDDYISWVKQTGEESIRRIKAEKRDKDTKALVFEALEQVKKNKPNINTFWVLCDDVSGILENYISLFYGDKIDSKLLPFLTGGEISLINAWIKDNCREDTEALAERILNYSNRLIERQP